MNVNMVEHQRSILAVLGIDVWVPKVDVPTHSYTDTLYRDQDAPFRQVEPSITVLNPVVENNQNTVLNASSTLIDTAKPEVTLVRQQPSQDVIELASDVNVGLEARIAIQIEPFELQAWCLEGCVIVLNATQLSPEQHNLWRNIQAAKLGSFFDLKWPFALSPLQDGRGAEAYIQGFLDAMRGENKVFSLGKIEHTNMSMIEQLPSLQEMLDQPQLKRRLWQIMSNSAD